MDIGTAMSVVQTLLAALQCPQLIAFCSKKSLSSQLDQLQGTVRRIQAVLEDAESKQVLSKQEQIYIEELKDVVFEADDLFDEFVTLANRNKLNDGIKDRLSSFFSKFKVDHRILQKVDKIKQKLDDIASRNQIVAFKHDPEPIKKRSRETCSYVHAVDIIGRDDDVETIVGMLLQSNGQRSVSFLSIVGIGGLGKTALAQLVFNDPRVTSNFQLKLWICVSDQDQNDFEVGEILSKILEAATQRKHDGVTMDQLQSQLRQELDGKKYLLVLDDVWTENRNRWCNLVEFLKGGQRGSWVLVTTRSRRTTSIVGDGLMHDLKGLSEESSWRLFKVVAFGSELSSPAEDLVNIGQKIVQRCANVPLSIKVAGSLLYGQDKRTWLSFQNLPLLKNEENKTGIMDILKLSYNQLESPLKSCFGYCALFPKDYEIAKSTLMRLWMAQGYIPSSDQRSMQDIAEDYFLVLLRRCFFQDVCENDFGEISSVKIHDLMHDVACEVIGKEICGVDSIIDVVDKRVRHISTIRRELKGYTSSKSSIRSYLRFCPSSLKDGMVDQPSVDALLANWKCLRVLDLRNLEIRSLPSSIGDLIHLRYLNLSYNRNLKLLPKRITKLCNLETLDLYSCSSLKELPKDISKLVKLTALDIHGCYNLSGMPRGMGKLTCLEELTTFLVGEANYDPQKVSNGLEDLKALTNLKGTLQIQVRFFGKDRNAEKDGGREGGCLSNKAHLTCVNLTFSGEHCERRVKNDEEIIEDLQPHSNIKGLGLRYYESVRMPKWAMEYNLANLVIMQLSNCPYLQSLGCLGTLQHLKSLRLGSLWSLEWLVEDKNIREGISDREHSCGLDGLRLSKVEEFLFFPSLEELEWRGLQKLKGWCRGVGREENDQLLRLPKLKTLMMENCPKLTANVECLELKSLILSYFNKKFGIKLETMNMEEKEKKDEKQKLKKVTSANIPKLQRISISDLGWLNSRRNQMVQCVEFLHIHGDGEVESLGEAQEVFRICSSSLRFLCIEECSNLRSISGGLEHLTKLEFLGIYHCCNLSLSKEGESMDGDDINSDSGMPWQSLSHSLRTLKLTRLPQLVNLPSWVLKLTTLQTLEISSCKNLKSLPSWMSKLTSLRELKLRKCPAHLKERCEQSTGEDWPHIKHISSITIKDGW